LMFTINDKTPPVDPTLCAMIFSPDYRVRVIVLSTTESAARAVLPDQNVDQMQHIWIRPIGVRVGDLPSILKRVFSAHSLPLTSLTRANCEQLHNHEWRGNWRELNEAADRLASISRIADWEGLGWRERARALGIAKSTLHDWYKGLRFTAPLFEAAP